MRPTKSLSRRTANPDSLVKKGVYNNHKTFTHRKYFFRQEIRVEVRYYV